MSLASPDLAPEQAAGRTDSRSNGTDMKADWCCLAFLTALVTAIFHPVLFLGKSISRSALLPEWDAAFAGFQKGVSALYDPSLLQLFIPNYTFVAKTLHQGQLPLWNPHNGFGCPFIGDIQTSIFSPLRLFFNACPTLETYNLTLVLELLICAAGTFALSRALGLGRIASLLPAVAYTFCPFNLWYLELNLGTSGCLFPLVMLLFVRAAKQTTLAASMLAGAGAALLILCGHPESSFFGILSASLMLVLLKLFSPEKAPLLSKSVSAAKSLFTAGFVCTGLAAPVLVPFLEYLKNSETYKYTSVSSAHVPWQGVLYNLVNPAVGGASPYLGILVLLLLPFSFLALRSKATWMKTSTIALLTASALSFVLVTQLGPVELLFTKAPMTYVITRYLAPVFLMILTLLAAVGCQSLSENLTANQPRKPLLYAAVALTTATGMLFLAWTLRADASFLKSATFDLMLPATAFNSSAWKRDIWLAVGFLASLLIVPGLLNFRFLNKHAGIAFGILCLALNSFSLSIAAKLSLPVQPSFFYPEISLMADIKDPSSRIVSTGDHLLRPATNAVYEVNSIQAHNPLFPKRYLTYMKALGAQVDMFNQQFGSRLSPLLDLSAVRHVVSQLPVYGAEWQQPAAKNVDWLKRNDAEYGAGTKLTGCEYWCDQQTKAAGGKFNWQLADPTAASAVTWSLSLLDKNNQAVWFSDQNSLPAAGGAQPFLIPLPIENTKPLKLCLRLFDRQKVSWLTPRIHEASLTNVGATPCVAQPDKLTKSLPEVQPPQIADQGVVLGELTPTTVAKGSSHFTLVKEHANHVRVYRNERALPRAYAVFAARNVSGEQASLRAIQSGDFDPTREVILEDAPAAVVQSLAAWATHGVTPTSTDEQLVAARLQQDGPNQILTQVDSPRAGIFVLLDNWYPGWKAYLDGKEVPTFRANYLFKAIQLPPGRHNVVFSYQPASFVIGLMALAATILLGAGVFLTNLRDRQL